MSINDTMPVSRLRAPQHAKKHGSIVVAGPDLESFEEHNWTYLLGFETIILARALPEHKRLLVERLRSNQLVVAAIGDSLNDALLLKAADVGIAVGMACPVAALAADLAVVDNGDGVAIESIAAAIAVGRTMFRLLRQGITYIRVSSVAQLMPFLMYVALDIPLALDSTAILLADLGTNALAPVTLAWEAPEGDTMTRGPRESGEHLVTAKGIAQTYLSTGLLQAVCCYVAFYLVLADRGFEFSSLFGAGIGFNDAYEDLSSSRQKLFEDMCRRNHVYLSAHQAPLDARNSSSAALCTTDFADYRITTWSQGQSAYYLALVFGQCGNLVSRKTAFESIFTFRRLVNNRPMLAALIAELCLALASIYLPWLGRIFRFASLPAPYVLLCLCALVPPVAFHEVRKAYLRRRHIVSGAACAILEDAGDRNSSSIVGDDDGLSLSREPLLVGLNKRQTRSRRI